MGEGPTDHERLAELEGFNQRLAIFNEMIHGLNAATSEEDVFRLAAHFAPRLVRAERASICLVQPDGIHADIFALEGSTGTMPAHMKLRLADTGVGRAIAERRVINTSFIPVEDIKQDHIMLTQFGMKSSMCVPLITGGVVIGTVNVASTIANAYGARDETLMTQLASLLGTTLQNRRLVNQVKEALALAETERSKSDQLLLNILPAGIAERLKRGEGMIADRLEKATVLFADIVGFTTLSATISPAELVTLLNRVFSSFDRHVEELGLEKIKTIGDAYMVVGGLREPLERRPGAVMEMALHMNRELAILSEETGRSLQLRIGIHSGEVVAGVIGTRTIAFDLWGDTVNTASRMESHGLPGRIHCTAAVADMLRGQYEFEERAPIEIKGKGLMTTYLLRHPLG